MNLRKRRSLLWLLAGLAVALAPMAAGHVWINQRSVHFRGTPIDFGTPPPRVSDASEDPQEGTIEAWRPGTQYVRFEDRYFPFWDYQDEDPEEAKEKLQETLSQRARNAEAHGRWARAAHAWREQIQHGFAERGELTFRLALLDHLAAHPQERGGPALIASTAYQDIHVHPVPGYENISKGLLPFLAYVRADRENDVVKSGEDWLSLAERYPHSVLAEAALIQVPRTTLAGPASKITPQDKRLAVKAMHELMFRHPHTRFAADVMGWRARLAYLDGQYHQVLAIYRQELEAAPNDSKRRRALDSIKLCMVKLGNKAGLAEAELLQFELCADRYSRATAIKEFQRNIETFGNQASRDFGHRARSSPALLVAYLDYRLDITDATAELLRLTSCPAVRRASNSQKARIFSRVAEAALHLHHPAQARALASAAIQINPKAAALATYILGSLALHRHADKDAEHYFSTLVKSAPNSYLAPTARENLALIYERQGQYGRAIRTYQALGYIFDVAYLLDVRMRPEQIRAYAATRSGKSDYPLLQYSLGLRYLRDHRFDEAVSTLQSIPRKQLAKLERKSRWGYRFDDKKDGGALMVAKDLGRLNARVQAAPTRRRKAEAMYALALYYYNHGTLSLYNAALWKGERSELIAWSWNGDINTRADNRALDEHHWKHETFAQAFKLCKQIVRDYPSERVSYHAAYTAACAAERLAKFNDYWRWENFRINLFGQAEHYMNIAKRSPSKWLSAKAAKYAGVFAEEGGYYHDDWYGANAGFKSYKTRYWEQSVPNG